MRIVGKLLEVGGSIFVAMALLSNAIAKPETPPSNVTRKPSAIDQAEISKVLEDQDISWAAGDAAGYTARALPEITLTNVVGEYLVGKDALLSQVREIFSTIYKGSRTKTTLVHIAMIGDDVAVVDTISQLKGFAHAAMESVVIDGATYSRLQETMVKRNGSWWIASIHNVFIDPEFADKAALPK